MGQGTLYKVQTGDPIPDADCNCLSAAIAGDMVPRDPATFEATDIGAKLGTGAFRWDDSLFEKIFPGLSSNGLEIDEEDTGLSKNFLIKSLGNVICRILADGSVDRKVLGSVNKVIGSLTSSFNVTSTSQVTYSTLSITTSGRPVIVGLLPGIGSVLEIGNIVTQTADPNAAYLIRRNGSTIYYARHYSPDIPFTNILGSGIPTSSIWFFDTPAAGTYTYDFQAALDTSNGRSYLSGTNIQLMAYELS